MKNKNSVNLYNELQKLTDYRRPQGRMHELRFILILVIMSVMSGFSSLRAMDDFIKKNKSELQKKFNPKYRRFPSFNTIARTLRAVDFDEFSEIFTIWASQNMSDDDKRFLSIDGKAIRGTVSGAGSSEQNFVSLISVFASDSKVVLCAKKINTKKENETPAVREIVKLLDLKKAHRDN